MKRMQEKGPYSSAYPAKSHPNTAFYRYKAFGISIGSEFPFEELEAVREQPEVLIQFGEVPEHIPEPSTSGVRFEASPGLFLLKIDDVAGYLVKDGRYIYIQKENPYVSDNEVRLFLLGPVMGALILQRGLLPVHGSAVKMGEQAVIFSGTPGVGKSTLATGFLNKGYSVISDDISVININGETVPYIYPGFPQMKLWADMLDKFGKDRFFKRTLREGLQKYGIPVRDQYYGRPLPIGHIYILSTHNKDTIHSTPLHGMNKFHALKNNTYRWRFLEGLGKKKEHFSLTTQLAEQIGVSRITRPRQSFKLDELMEMIMAEE